MTLKVYGCRATIPCSGPSFARYGGGTTCVLVSSGSHHLIVDAGSGLMRLEEDLHAGQTPDILLGHLHLDHLIGLTVYGPVWNREESVRIFTKDRDGRPMKAQVFGAFKPPYWPVDMVESTSAQVTAIREDEAFAAGGAFTVTPFVARHPDGTTAFHITNGEKNLVYLLDYELNGDPYFERTIRYCRQADAVVFDAAFSPEDYPRKRGWGHSTFCDAARLAEASGCKRIILSHFGQMYNDDDLDALAQRAASADSRLILARDGMEFSI